MKQEIVPDFLWHLDQVVFTFQTTIVTTVDAAGRVNAAPFGLVMPFSTAAENPQMLIGSNARWQTARNILQTGEFIINYPSYRLLKQVAVTGLFFPEGVNELEKAGLTELPGLKVRPPRILECFQHIECTLGQVIQANETQQNFVGDIVSITRDEKLLAGTKEDRLQAADPLLLFGMDIANLEGRYAGVGKVTVYAPPRDDKE